MTRDEFSKLFAYLQAGCGMTKPATAVQAEVYFDCLGHLDFEAAKRACKSAILSGKFPTLPPVGRILELAGIQVDGLTASDRATIAYNEAAKAVSSVGQYASVDFQDSVTNAVIRGMGGWERFCSWNSDEVQWRKRDFLELYNAYAKSGVPGELCAPLHGLCAIENTRTAHGSPGVVCIATSLPAHRQGIIRGEVPKRIDHKTSEFAKRLAESMKPAGDA